MAQVEQKYRTEFLDQLFSSDNPIEEGFLERAKTFGWDLSLDYVTILLDVLPSKEIANITEYESMSTGKNAGYNRYFRVLQEKSLRHILTRHASGILLFASEEVELDDTPLGLSVCSRKPGNWKVDCKFRHKPACTGCSGNKERFQRG